MPWDETASEHWEADLWEHLRWLWAGIADYVKYTIQWNPRYRDLAWEAVKIRSKHVFLAIFAKAKDAFEDAKDYADALIENLPEIAENVWGSITSLWARFGAGILDTSHTVESWIRAKLDFMYSWMTGTYDAARTWVAVSGDWVVAKADEVATWIETWADSIVTWIEDKADTVWTWIEDKADTVWEWIETTAAVIEEWYDRNAEYYSGIYDTYRGVLTSFLEDPALFILDFVVDGFEYVVSWAVTLYW